MRVDFLTPNRGRETELPQKPPALGTDAQPLRFLDFLIRDPVPAVLLHGTGVLVSVPEPQRYALHKLIVARRRREGTGKRGKDLSQAEALLDALIQRRPHELRAAWAEAFSRGKNWQRPLGEGLGLLHPATRDKVLRTVGAPRAVIPGLDLHFLPGRVGYDNEAAEVYFFGQVRSDGAGSEGIRCSVEKDALEARFGPGPFDRDRCLAALRQHRSLIEQVVRAKYLKQPVGFDHDVLLTRADLAAVK